MVDRMVCRDGVMDLHERGGWVLYYDYATLESHLSAIASALGCPDVPVDGLPLMVRDLKSYHEETICELESIIKERDSIRSQRDMLVEALEYYKEEDDKAWDRGEIYSNEYESRPAAKALAKVRQGGEG